MKVLVTGAAGFIGSSISRRLLSDGYDVVGIDSFTDYYNVELKRANAERLSDAKFRLVEADINDVDVSELLRGIDVVFHQAGQPGVRASWGTEFDVYLDRNIRATQRLLEAAKTSGGLTRFVYASSSSVYGEAAAYPTYESGATAPMSPYGTTKLAAEHLVSLYAKNFGIPTTSLRYFTVYGPRQRPDMAFSRFIRAAILEQPIRLFGTGAQVRDFTFVDDIVEANLRAIERPHASGSVFNLAGGSNVSMNDVIAEIGRLAGTELRVERTVASAGDVTRTSGSTELAAEALGWSPRVQLEDGLAEQLSWLKSTRADWEGQPQDWS